MGAQPLPPPPPFRPIRRRRAGAILYGLAALAGAGWFAALREPLTEAAPHSRLEQAVAGADRLVFVAGEERLLEVRGEGEVRDFVALLEWHRVRPEEFKEQEGPITYRAVFYRGDRELARLDSVAKYALRWVGGGFPGDVVITPRSREKLHRWFVAHNAPQLLPSAADTRPK